MRKLTIALAALLAACAADEATETAEAGLTSNPAATFGGLVYSKTCERKLAMTHRTSGETLDGSYAYTSVEVWWPYGGADYSFSRYVDFEVDTDGDGRPDRVEGFDFWLDEEATEGGITKESRTLDRTTFMNGAVTSKIDFRYQTATAAERIDDRTFAYWDIAPDGTKSLKHTMVELGEGSAAGTPLKITTTPETTTTENGIETRDATVCSYVRLAQGSLDEVLRDAPADRARLDEFDRLLQRTNQPAASEVKALWKSITVAARNDFTRRYTPATPPRPVRTSARFARGHDADFDDGRQAALDALDRARGIWFPCVPFVGDAC